jgi:hypothetical protein
MSSAEENISPSNCYVSFIKKNLVNEGKYTITDLEKELKMVLLEYGKVFNIKLINTSDPHQYLIDINIELYDNISKNLQGKIKTRYYDRFKQYLTISKNYKSYTSTPTQTPTKFSSQFNFQEKLNNSINFIKLDNIQNIKRYRQDEDNINTSSAKYVCDRNNKEEEKQKIIQEQEKKLIQEQHRLIQEQEQHRLIQEQEQHRLIQEQEQHRLIQEQEQHKLIQEQQKLIQEQEQHRLLNDYNLNLVLKDSYGTDLVITRSFFPAYFLLSSYRHNIRKNCVEKFNSIEDLLTAESNYSNIKFTPLYMHGIESFSFNHFVNS